MVEERTLTPKASDENDKRNLPATQIEAAARALRDDKANRTETHAVPAGENTPDGDKTVFRGRSRAALIAAFDELRRLEEEAGITYD